MGLFAKPEPKNKAPERREPAHSAPRATRQHHTRGDSARQNGATAAAHPSARGQQVLQQRPPNGFANENPQIPGQRPLLQVQLDPNFRAAAKKSTFFAAFIKAHDKMSRGQV